MENNNLTTSENDKTGLSINPRGMPMTLEIKFKRPLIRQLFDKTAKSHNKYYDVNTNINSWLTPQQKIELGAINRERYKTQLTEYFDKMCLTFRIKVNDLDEACLIANKYLEEYLQRDIADIGFSIFYKIKQDSLIECNLKMSGMTIGKIKVNSGEVYKFDPVADITTDKVYTSSLVKEMYSSPDKTENIKKAMFEIADTVEKYFQQVEDFYIQYYTLLKNNFSSDEKMMLYFSDQIKERQAAHQNRYDSIKDYDKLSKIDVSNFKWNLGIYTFGTTNSSFRITGKQVFKILNFSTEELGRVVRSLAFLFFLKQQKAMYRASGQEAQLLNRVVDDLDSREFFVQIRNIGLMPQMDTADLTLSAEEHIHNSYTRSSTRYQVGLCIVENKSFSIIREKERKDVVSIIGMCKGEEGPATYCNNSSYDNKRNIVLNNSEPSQILDILDRPREFAQKFLMMTDLFASTLNKLNLLESPMDRMKEILIKYEIDEETFSKQFLTT